MNRIDVCAAVDCLPDEAALDAALRAKGYAPMPASSADTSRYEVEDEVGLDELLARLEPGHGAADIFLPIRFDAPFVLDGTRYGCVSTLLRALTALREELELDTPRGDRSSKLLAQRKLWRTFRLAAKEARAKHGCLAILRDL